MHLIAITSSKARMGRPDTGPLPVDTTSMLNSAQLPPQTPAAASPASHSRCVSLHHRTFLPVSRTSNVSLCTSYRCVLWSCERSANARFYPAAHNHMCRRRHMCSSQKLDLSQTVVDLLEHWFHSCTGDRRKEEKRRTTTFVSASSRLKKLMLSALSNNGPAERHRRR